MQIGVLALVCLAILTISGVSEDFAKRFSITNFGLFMFSFSALVLNAFCVKIVPEFILNPASVFLIFVMLVGGYERGEKGFFSGMAAVFMIASVQIVLSQYVSGEFWGLIGIILPIALTEKRTFISLLCICAAPFLAYVATVILEALGVSNLYLSHIDVFNAQVTGILSVAVSAYLVNVFGKDSRQLSAKKAE